MSNVPAELKYVDTHEWLRLEADGTVTIGITDHAQELLGDVVYVELPEVGAQLAEHAVAGVVESVKAASDVYAPIAGEVVAINEELVASPELANTAPYGEAWFFRVKPADANALDGLMDAAGYTDLIGA
ncbi:glycine cleavage system protein GcvH [Andreprevotia chitinilytica]|uniref:glycine cleavage system protein GcvH n=1 Tax=Andreprevotia chitinilytica TaxID=396808 RepID=UPI0005554731|nr:glycine cleavage system protein GcvH [Andreprevotia chitinilytica]